MSMNLRHGKHYLLLIKMVENSKKNSKMAKGSGKSSTSVKKFATKAEIQKKLKYKLWILPFQPRGGTVKLD